MKWSNDADELGASKVGAIVMGETPFQTNEAVRQIVLNAKAGVQSIDDGLYQDAKDRGNYLEPTLTEWASDKLDNLCPDNVVCNYTPPIDAHRIKEMRLCASLDGILEVVGGELTIPNPQGDDISVSGFGALEIKTDGWDDGPPRADQVIQLQTQMLCAGFKWGVIAKLGPKLKFTLFPYRLSEKLVGIIIEKVAEFWDRVDRDLPYPPIDNGKPDSISLDSMETRDDVIQIITDYNQCKAEEKAWKLKKEQCQEALELVLDEVDAEYATIGEYKISFPIIKRKATPEKIVPAKPSTEHRRFSIEENK
tara:strand:+ start:761 stop:1684 length:924 start_codon:yes stop_codon:yes gene_type:complete